MKLTKSMTKADVILIVVLIVLSIAGLFGIFWLGKQTGPVRYISVQVDGVESQRIPLDQSTEGKLYSIKTKYGENVIEIHNQAVHVLEADCPDQLCVHQGDIDKDGHMLICLPNRLLVEIVSSEEEEKTELDGIVK